MYDINERAMLVTLSIRQWSAQKHDKRVSQEVAQNHGSDPAMGRYNKSLIAREALEKIKQAAGAARTEHYFRTAPWTDDGARILSSTGFFEYQAKLKALETTFMDAVEAFLEGYPQYVEEARRRLNGLFNEADYPPPAKMRARFAFETQVRPIPAAADFRVDLGDIETARIRSEIEAAVKATIDGAMRDTWTRLKDVVSHMAERLKAYQVTKDGVQNPFRDTLVSNITELLEILPSLNLTGDPNLTAIADQIRRDLTAAQPCDLREHAHVRQAVAQRAEEILSKMEAFIA